MSLRFNEYTDVFLEKRAAQIALASDRYSTEKQRHRGIDDFHVKRLHLIMGDTPTPSSGTMNWIWRANSRVANTTVHKLRSLVSRMGVFLYDLGDRSPYFPIERLSKSLVANIGELEKPDSEHCIQGERMQMFPVPIGSKVHWACAYFVRHEEGDYGFVIDNDGQGCSDGTLRKCQMRPGRVLNTRIWIRNLTKEQLCNQKFLEGLIRAKRECTHFNEVHCLVAHHLKGEIWKEAPDQYRPLGKGCCVESNFKAMEETLAPGVDLKGHDLEFLRDL